MTLDIAWKFNFNPQVRQQLDQAIHDGVEEVFELDIKPEAVKGSPVRTGTNRRSLDRGPSLHDNHQAPFAGPIPSAPRYDSCVRVISRA